GLVLLAPVGPTTRERRVRVRARASEHIRAHVAARDVVLGHTRIRRYRPGGARQGLACGQDHGQRHDHESDRSHHNLLETEPSCSATRKLNLTLKLAINPAQPPLARSVGQPTRSVIGWAWAARPSRPTPRTSSIVASSE